MSFAELACLALTVYFEARNQPERGQIAVAVVVMNRVDSWKYPDTVCEVVQQSSKPGLNHCQFSYFCDGLEELATDEEALNQAMWVAILVGAEKATIPQLEGVLHYGNPITGRLWWKNHMTLVTTIGDHEFYLDD